MGAGLSKFRKKSLKRTVFPSQEDDLPDERLPGDNVAPVDVTIESTEVFVQDQQPVSLPFAAPPLPAISRADPVSGNLVQDSPSKTRYPLKTPDWPVLFDDKKDNDLDDDEFENTLEADLQKSLEDDQAVMDAVADKTRGTTDV